MEVDDVELAAGQKRADVAYDQRIDVYARGVAGRRQPEGMADVVDKAVWRESSTAGRPHDHRRVAHVLELVREVKDVAGDTTRKRDVVRGDEEDAHRLARDPRAALSR